MEFVPLNGSFEEDSNNNGAKPDPVQIETKLLKMFRED